MIQIFNFQDTIDANGGNQHLDYNQLNKLKFLEAFIKESLRNWAISVVVRTCTKDYFIPELNITIPKGSVIQVPGFGIMHQEKFYKNPNKFDPEGHFDSEILIPSTFFSFSQGPRNCIGMRFAMLIMKSLLVTVLANYKVLPGPGMKNTFEIYPLSPHALPKGGVHIKLEKRQ